MNSSRTAIAALDVLPLLLRGRAEAAGHIANTLRAEAHGVTCFGRTDVLDHFARHPVVLSATPHVLAGPDALALLDTDVDGATLGIFAELADGVIARVWMTGAVGGAVGGAVAGAVSGAEPGTGSGDARPEPAVPVASDDFMDQERVLCAGDARDHPHLATAAWPWVQAAGRDALAAAAEGPLASSSQAWVVRTFSSGDGFAALLALRVQAATGPGMPRGAHRRWAVAAGRFGADGALLHRRLAVSAAWPAPAHVFF